MDTQKKRLGETFLLSTHNKYQRKIRNTIKALDHMYASGSVVVDSLLIITPIVGFCNFSIDCYAVLCVHYSFAFILMGKI